MTQLFPTVARNSLFNTFSKLSIKVIAFVFSIFVIRWLGDDGYGQYSLVWSYIMVFAIFSDVGLTMYAIREIAKNSPNTNDLISNIIVLRIVLASLTIFFIVTSVWLSGAAPNFTQMIFVASLILLLYAVQDPLDAALQAYERFDLVAIITITGQLVLVISGVSFLILGGHIIGLIIAGLLHVLVMAVLAWYLIPQDKQILLSKVNITLWPALLGASWSFGLMKLWLIWSLKLDILILAWFWEDWVVGWYSAVYTIILGLLVISNAINAALYPTLSRLYDQQPDKLPKIYDLILKFLLVISLPIAGIFYVTAQHWIILLFGSEFIGATPVLKILIWVVPLTFVSEFLRYVLLVTNRERAAIKALGGVVSLGIILNLWWIPTHSLFAAARIVIITEASLVVSYIWIVRKELTAIHIGNSFIKPVSATLILIITMTVLTSFGPFLQILLGSVLYLGLLLLLKTLKPNEYTLLVGLLKYIRNEVQDFTISRTNTSPLVSVFIPTYNAAPFLAQAIDSVLQQSYQNYELIIINDASTDNTVEILEQYRHHPKITIHHNPRNMGMASNWNIGLGLCQAEYIAKLDADDFYEPNYLQTAIDFLQSHTEVGLFFSGSNLVYPDGRIEPEMPWLKSWVRQRQDFLAKLLQLCSIRSPTVCVRKACYEAVGHFAESMKIHADWEMWVRIAANYPVGFIPRCLANYRMNYGLNCTSQAAVDGRSMDDLKYWLSLIEEDKVPYHLTPEEQNIFRRGIYDLEMHFAGMAAYLGREDMSQAYVDFAEQVLAAQPSSAQIIQQRQVYLNLHQGLFAFRDQRLTKARHHFLQAIKAGPVHCTPLWIWSKLLLTFLGRTKWGILHK